VSEALRLADALLVSYEDDILDGASAELRRLAAVEQAYEALKKAISEAKPFFHYRVYNDGFQDLPEESVIPLYTLKGIK